MNGYKRILIFILSLITFTGCFAGCGGGNNSKGEAELFSAYVTTVVMQDKEVADADKLSAAFNYVCGKGETETAQIIMNALTAVSEYTFTVSDLTDEKGNVFHKENFEVFNQKYIEVINPTKNEESNYGFFPDALLPFDKAAEYNENKIEKGKNQAILVSASIPADQPAGNYSGSFSLVIDGKEVSVPVNMKIYDVTYPTATGLESIYIINRYELAAGEADDTLSMYEKYYEKMLEYKCAGYQMPVSSGNAEAYANAVRKYFDKIPNYSLSMCVVNVGGKTYDLDVEATWKYVEEILKLSIADGKEYLSKAANYYGIIDEPTLNDTVNECSYFCDSYNAGVKTLSERVKNYKNNSGYTAEQIKIIESEADSVLNMPNYVTAEKQPYYTGVTETEEIKDIRNHVKNYCPLFNKADTEVDRAAYDTKKWYYGCNQPTSPYANFHIDSLNHLESTQLLGWTSNEYDFSGVLYWETVYYRGYYARPGFDCYKTALRNSNSNGEGFLLYPGAPYGIDGPVASLRLVSMRDGADDYDLLKILENLYAEKGYDAAQALNVIYRSLYNGMKCVNDNHATLFNARESVFNLIGLAENGVFIDKTETTGNGYRLSGVSENENEVKVNGAALNLSDKRFSFEIKLSAKTNSYILSSGDYSVNYTVDGVKSAVFGGNTEPKLKVIDTTLIDYESVDGSGIGISGNVIKIDFKNAEEKTFAVTGDGFDKLYNKNTKDAIFGIYNAGDTAVLVIEAQGAGIGTVELNKVFLKNGYNEIHLNDLSVIKWKVHKKLDYITFTVKGETDGANEINTVYLCDASVVVK